MSGVTSKEVKKEKRKSIKPHPHVPRPVLEVGAPKAVSKLDGTLTMLPAKVIDESNQLTGKSEVLATVRMSLDEGGTWIVEILGTRPRSEDSTTPGSSDQR